MKKMSAEKPLKASKKVAEKATKKQPKKDVKASKVMKVEVKTGGGYGDKGGPVGERLKGMKKRDMGMERAERKGER